MVLTHLMVLMVLTTLGNNTWDSHIIALIMKMIIRVFRWSSNRRNETACSEVEE